ncbi:hypothetical protein GQ42DRAFT_158886 [Ramicandelaber brevisporus]|nr:hypothetical protein GQ42DRAFT_158886 [Ramicandelaber brevisporus]
MTAFNSIEINTDAKTVTVGAGAIMADVQAELVKHGLALEHTPAYGNITIGGGIGTGSHGSSLVRPATLGEQMVGLKVVYANGTVAEITGDDLRFYRPHLGLLGVVFEVTLRVVPVFKIYGEFAEHDDSILSTLHHIAADKDLYMAYWYPSQKKVISYSAQYLPITAPGDGAFLNLTPSMSGPFLFFYKSLVEVGGPLMWCVLEREVKQGMMSRSWIAPASFYNNDKPSTSGIGYPHQMLYSICDVGECPWNQARMHSLSIAVSTVRAAEAIQIVRDIHKQYPECFPNIGILLRFAKGTTKKESAAAVEMDRDTLHLDAAVTPYSEERPFFKEYVRRLITEVDGRLHWGKSREWKDKVNFDVSDFTAYMKSVDPDGRFQNDWSKIVFG